MKRRRKRKDRKEVKVRIVRRDEDGSEIRRNLGSIGYQVFHQDNFIIFVTNVNVADRILDEVQELHEKGVKTPWIRQYG